MSRNLLVIDRQRNYERNRKREQDQMRKEYIQSEGYKVIEMWEVNWWELYRTDATVKHHLRANFPYQRPLSEGRLMQEIRNWWLFGYVQCDLKVLEHLKTYFAKFPPKFKNAVISGNDIGGLMKDYAKKDGIMPQPRRLLISSFQLKNGIIITPLLIYYLHPGLDCTKIHQSVQCTPKKGFRNCAHCAINAQRYGDGNPNSSVVVETMKFLAISSYVYQLLDHSRHTVTKFLNDEKTHSANIYKLFKRLNFITDQLYEVKLVKSEIEHREPIIVGFFILQYAQLRVLELYYVFFKKFRYTEIYEELEMDTDSLYLALLEEGNEWEAIRSRDCTDSFAATATSNFFPRTWTCCTAHKKHNKKEPALFKQNFRCSEMLCLCSKTYCCYDRKSNK